MLAGISPMNGRYDGYTSNEDINTKHEQDSLFSNQII